MLYALRFSQWNKLFVISFFNNCKLSWHPVAERWCQAFTGQGAFLIDNYICWTLEMETVSVMYPQGAIAGKFISWSQETARRWSRCWGCHKTVPRSLQSDETRRVVLFYLYQVPDTYSAAAAKSCQSCPTLLLQTPSKGYETPCYLTFCETRYITICFLKCCHLKLSKDL